MRRFRLGRSGFTLVEVIVVTAIISIVALITVPQFRTILQNADLRSAGRDLYGHVQYARMEAIKRNESVKVVFFPTANPSYNIATSSGEIIMTNIFLPEGLVLEEMQFTNNTTSFSSRGRSGGGNGSVVVKDRRNANGKTLKLTVSSSGNIRLEG